MANKIPKWSDNTREERYFTAALFGALLDNVDPFWSLLRPRLGIANEVTIVDIGFEVCMLRDLAHANHIKREAALEKQTFDFVLTLSNDALVLIEAKAHQGFLTRQLENMARTANILLNNSDLGISHVHIAGLHSAKYAPSNVRKQFPAMALLTWLELAPAYPNLSSQLKRANDIYNN